MVRRRLGQDGFGLSDGHTPRLPPSPLRNLEPIELKVGDERARYLAEIARVSNHLARKVETIVERGHFPLVLGGDHSIAVGTVSGIVAFGNGLGGTLFTNLTGRIV